MNVQAIARHIHALGANVLPIEAETKKPSCKWTVHQATRQTVDVMRSFKFPTTPTISNGTTYPAVDAVGIVNGAPTDDGPPWRHIDVDGIVTPDGTGKYPVPDAVRAALLRGLGLDDGYEWARPSKRKGVHIWVRYDGELPPDIAASVSKVKANDGGGTGVKVGTPLPIYADAFSQIELRHERCQSVIAPSDPPFLPVAAPAVVSIEALCNALRAVATFGTKTPDAPTKTTATKTTATKTANKTYIVVNDAVYADIREKFDLVRWFEAKLGGETQDDHGETRILGHNGLMVNTDKRCWYVHGAETGGGWADAIAYTEHHGTTPTGAAWFDMVRVAAGFCGVVLQEEERTTRTADTASQCPTPTTPTQLPPNSHPTPTQLPRFTVRTERELADLPDPSWLLKDEIQKGGYHLLYGASGSGKTFLALDRALRAVATGARCLYIATEDLSGLKLRTAAWRSHHRGAAGRLAWLDMPNGLDLSNADHVDELMTAITGRDLDLITIDTLREAHTGDENSSQAMAAVNRAIQQMIRETGAAVDVVHHSGVNDGRERGSTALGANCDLKWKVSGDDGGFVTVTCEKFRHGAIFTPRYYRITPTINVVDGAVLLPVSNTTDRGDSPLTAGQRAILEHLSLSIFDDIGAKTTQIAEATNVRAGSLYRALDSLKKKAFITQGSKGDPYTITLAGRAAIGPHYHPTPTADTASQSPTPTTPTQLPPNSHPTPSTTTTPTTRRVGVGSSGGSGNEENQTDQTIQQPPTPAPTPAALPRYTVQNYAINGPPRWSVVCDGVRVAEGWFQTAEDAQVKADALTEAAEIKAVQPAVVYAGYEEDSF